jgi:hypothetical protein
MTSKKNNPFIEKMQKNTGNDGAQGASASPTKKVLGANKPIPMKRIAGNDTMPKGKPTVPPMKAGSKMCPACMSAKKSSCSHQ